MRYQLEARSISESIAYVFPVEYAQATLSGCHFHDSDHLGHGYAIILSGH